MDAAQQVQMLSALENDPLYGRHNAPVYAHVWPFIIELPAILDELLACPVTLQNLFRAKYRFLTWAVGHGYNLRAAEAVLETYAMWTERPHEALPPKVSEKRYMLSDEVGLIETLGQGYRRGSLTINDIVLFQPSLFLS